MKWKNEVERLWRLHPHQAGLRRSLAKDAPGFTVIGDNVGLVSLIREGVNIKKQHAINKLL